MKTLRIDVTKIDKSKLFKGQKGTYLDLVLHDNRDGRDQYGNDGFVAQSVSKEEREAGVRGAIVGNWKEVGSGIRKPQERPAEDRAKSAEPNPDQTDDDNDPLPF